MTVTETTPRRGRLVAEREGSEPAPDPLLQLEDIHHGYELGGKKVHVLRGVDVALASGRGRRHRGPERFRQVHAHAPGRRAPAPDQGDVRLGGASLSAMGPRARAIARRTRIGFVFQAFHLLPGLDVIENVAMPLLLNGESRRALPRHAPVRCSTRSGSDIAPTHLPSELSGGELQRAAIARAPRGRPRRSSSPTSRPATSTARRPQR